MLAARRRALQGHQDAGLELGAGAGHLFLGDVAAHLGDFIADQGNQLFGFLLPGAGVNAEQAGVRITREKGVNAVHQAALFAHLLEQARGHAAAKQSGKDRNRVEVGVLVRNALEAEHHVDLFQIPVLAHLTAHVTGGIAGSLVAVRQALEGGLRQGHQGLVIHPAGGGHHHARGTVVGAHVLDDGVAPHVAHGVRRTENGTPQGLAGKGGLLEMVEHHVVGGVVGLVDFLENDRALARQLVGRQDRVLHDVGDDVHAQRQVLLENLGVIGGVFARGIGVEVAADGFDFLGNGDGTAPFRALEDHVLE